MIRKIFAVVGIFCLAYAVIPAVLFGILNAGVWAVAVLGALLLLPRKFWDRMRAVKPIWSVFIILVACGGIYAAIMSAAMINRAYNNEPPESGKLAVVVLGGGIRGDQPSLMLRRRLDAAYDYMQKNSSAICVVTGGQGSDEIMPESVVMRNYLITRGLEPERILFEDKSKSTRQNFEYAAKLIPQDSKVIVVTDGFHQLRAGIFAKAAGLDAPYSISSLTPWGLLPTYWLRELMGLPVAMIVAGN